MSQTSTLLEPFARRQSAKGGDPSRLEYLQRRSHCRCHRRCCFSKLDRKLESVSAFVRNFWTLTRPLQDLYVGGSTDDTDAAKIGRLLFLQSMV